MDWGTARALSCISLISLKHLILLQYSPIYIPSCEKENTAWQHKGLTHITTPVVFFPLLRLPKGKRTLTCFLWSFTVRCSTVLVLCSSLSFFSFTILLQGKLKRKEGGAKSESWPKCNHFFRANPIICIYVHFSDTTSATLVGPR